MSDHRNDDFEDDPVLAELRRVREEQSAAYGHNIERQIADSRRMQFLFGSDVVRRGPSGEFEVVFKGTGKFNIEAGRILAAPESHGEQADG